MSAAGPEVFVSPQLRPYLEDFEFDAESYAYGLRLMGASDELVDGKQVVFGFSDKPYTEPVMAGFLPGQSKLGEFDRLQYRTTLYPRTIAHCLLTARSEIAPEIRRQSLSLLSAAHNHILLHESGHFIEFATMDRLEELRLLGSDVNRALDMRKILSYGAITGAILGSELADVTTLPPFFGSMIGAAGLTAASAIHSFRRHRASVRDRGRVRAESERKAERMTRDLAAIALMGNVIQIDLRKKPARSFRLS